MPKTASHDKKMEVIADEMGISLYSRFDLLEASLFLRCSKDELNSLVSKNEISFIQVTSTVINFFGFQLLEYMLEKVIPSVQSVPTPQVRVEVDNRIIRFKEVQELVGVSRTTIWRWEMSGKFPMRVSLGAGSVGWMKSDIDEWIKSKANS